MKTVLLTTTLVLSSIAGFAYDFICNSIAYNIVSIDEQTVEVTKDDVKYYGTINIPESVVFKGKTWTVTAIGTDAFISCYNVDSVSIPNTVTQIGKSAFYGCDGLRKVVVPNSVTDIGNYAFSKIANLESVILPDGLEYIGIYAFDTCPKLTTIEIPNTVKRIGYGAFRDCKQLKSINIPELVTTIESSTFQRCSELTSVNIGSLVTSIQVNAFSDCPNLSEITLHTSTPPTLGSTVFSQLVMMDAKVIVPQGAMEAYKNADGWKDFFNIKDGATPTYLLTTSITGKGTVSIDDKDFKEGISTLVAIHGQSITCKIIPIEGYKIKQFGLASDEEVKTTSSMENNIGIFTIESLPCNATLSVVFEEITYEVDDTNHDGLVNSADIVHIYNRIINGK